MKLKILSNSFDFSVKVLLDPVDFLSIIVPVVTCGQHMNIDFAHFKLVFPEIHCLGSPTHDFILSVLVCGSNVSFQQINCIQYILICFSHLVIKTVGECNKIALALCAFHKKVHLCNIDIDLV